MKKLWLVCCTAFGALTMASCGGGDSEDGEGKQTGGPDTVQVEVSQIEPHTFANIDEIYTTDVHLDLEVDFDKKVLRGSATHTVENVAGTDKMIFDTDKLKIKGVVLDEKDSTTFSFGETDSLLGTALIVDVKPETKKVTIYYETAPDNSSALQWLNPQQTAGKEHPYLFTQGQAILTRSWIPVQDSPYKRITYSARLQVPSDLMAVMSADKEQMLRSEDGVYEFDMDIPIPCYLIALAVGDLEFRPIGPRTGVYAESSMIDKSAAELEDMETMVEECEKLYGEYKWGRYDVIVLPPSFPFGGMENPKLTFATPTILAGDKSLVSLIAHELAHSWSGNLVTNATWDDFWLNEGFTVYIENRIMEAVYGKDYADMLAQLEMDELKMESKEISEGSHPHDTQLKLDLEGRNPDDGMTSIAYNKGAYFLRTLEETYGREAFDDFLKGYFADHEFKTISTEDFVAYLEENLIKPSGKPFDYKAWIYENGIPSNVADRHSPRFDKVEGYLERLAKGSSVASLGVDRSDLSTHEWLHFIHNMPESVDAEKMKEIDAVLDFKNSGNSEIEGAWYVEAVKRGYHGADQEIEEFLINVGRRKFLTPIYSAMAATPEGKKWALRIYEKARPNYHSVSYTTIDEKLGYQKK